MLWPLVLLFCGSILLGYVFSDFFLGLGNIFLATGLATFPHESLLFETDLIWSDLKIFIFVVLLLLSMGFVASMVKRGRFLFISVKLVFLPKLISVLFLFFFLFNMK